MIHKIYTHLLIFSFLIASGQHNAMQASGRDIAAAGAAGIAGAIIGNIAINYWYNPSIQEKLKTTVNPFNDLLNAQTDEDRHLFAARLHKGQNPLRDTIACLNNALTTLQSLTSDKIEQKNPGISAEIESKQRTIRLLIEKIEKSEQYKKEKKEQRTREKHERQNQREHNANQAAQIALGQKQTQERLATLAINQQEADRLMRIQEQAEANDPGNLKLFRENKRKIEALKKQVNELESQASTDRSNIKYWKTQYHNVYHTIQKQNRTQKELPDINAALQKELDELKQKFDTLQKESKKSNQKLKQVEQELSDLKAPPAYTPPITRSRPLFSDPSHAASAPPYEEDDESPLKPPRPYQEPK